ncbi:Sulfotransferase cytosolic 1B member 1 [Bulinus truncatus]|nr:Sulfotransferase cytosolic 1B member 1 [Bulinus truncatus]
MQGPEELPVFLKRSGHELYGWPIPHYPMIKDPCGHVENIRNLEIRDDDVLVMAYPKCGTHWVWEIIHMLLNQTTDHERRTKEHAMLENTADLDLIRQQPSPRVLNSHLPLCHLPQDIVRKKTKIVHTVRNPKDTLVSMYHFFKGRPAFTLQVLLDAIINNNLSYHSQFDYLRHLTQFQKTEPDHPVLHIYYEELKKTPILVILKLARFLEVPATEDFCQKVAEACKFENMKSIEENGEKELPVALKELMSLGNRKFQMYRKGIAGDWKTELSKEQDDQLDAHIAAEMAKGLEFDFIYE